MLRTPARNLLALATSLAIMGASLLAACSQIDSPNPTGPGGKLVVPKGPSFDVTANYSSTEDPSAQSLGILMHGPSKAYFRENENGWYTFRATVSGGTGPYTYDWFQQYCYKRNQDGTPGYCSVLHRIPDVVQGLDSIEKYYPPEMGRMDFVVHVYDAQTYAHVGTARRIVTNFMTSTPPSSGFSCTIDEGTFYPVKDFDNRDYRRNGCTGAREYKPT